MSLDQLKERIKEEVLASDPRKMARAMIDQQWATKWLIYAVGFLTFLVWLLIVTRNDRKVY